MWPQRPNQARLIGRCAPETNPPFFFPVITQRAPHFDLQLDHAQLSHFWSCYGLDNGLIGCLTPRMEEKHTQWFENQKSISEHKVDQKSCQPFQSRQFLWENENISGKTAQNKCWTKVLHITESVINVLLTLEVSQVVRQVKIFTSWCFSALMAFILSCEGHLSREFFRWIRK